MKSHVISHVRLYHVIHVRTNDKMLQKWLCYKCYNVKYCHNVDSGTFKNVFFVSFLKNDFSKSHKIKNNEFLRVNI